MIMQEESYHQIISSNQCRTDEKHLAIQIHFTGRFQLVIFICLIFTSSPADALPTPSINSHQIQDASLSYMLRLTNYSTPPSIHPYQIYRHHPLPNYPNAAIVQISDPRNSRNKQLFQRERYRRTMIEKMFLLFDEDANAQLSKDELYSLTLRLNIFPKFHHFLRKTSTRK